MHIKVLAAIIGIWIVCMLILLYDQFSLDWAMLVTIILAMFGFIMQIAVVQGKHGVKIDDLTQQFDNMEAKVEEIQEDGIQGRYCKGK